METLLIILQAIVGISILNVWLVQPKKATQWRGGDAKTIIEEFHAYGLPTWSCYLVGTLKVTFAIMLIVGIWMHGLVFPAAAGLAVLLSGSVSMHFRIGDPMIKSLPAFVFLMMCLFIAINAYP